MQSNQNEWLRNKIEELSITDVYYDSNFSIVSIKTLYGRVDIDQDNHNLDRWRIQRGDYYLTNLDDSDVIKILKSIRKQQLSLDKRIKERDQNEQTGN